jgi:hypothetical protein
VGPKQYPLIGSVDGNRVAFAHDGEYQDQTFTILWTGTIEENGTITGRGNFQPIGLTGTFTASRSAAHA